MAKRPSIKERNRSRATDFLTKPQSTQRKVVDPPRTHERKTASSHTRLTANVQDDLEANASIQNEQITFYLEPTVIDALNQTQTELRRLTRKKPSKSAICNEALKEMLQEFARDHAGSVLFKKLR